VGIQLVLAIANGRWWVVGVVLLGLALMVWHLAANPARARADASGITRSVGGLTPKRRHLSYAEIARIRRMPGHDPPRAMFLEVPGQRILTYDWPGEDAFQQIQSWHSRANPPPRGTRDPGGPDPADGSSADRRDQHDGGS
jgi:hypothetical protein